MCTQNKTFNSVCKMYACVCPFCRRCSCGCFFSLQNSYMHLISNSIEYFFMMGSNSIKVCVVLLLSVTSLAYLTKYWPDLKGTFQGYIDSLSLSCIREEMDYPCTHWKLIIKAGERLFVSFYMILILAKSVGMIVLR